MARKPIYGDVYLDKFGCIPKSKEKTFSADDVLKAIQNADDETKQRLRDELAQCDCKETKDIFGDDPTKN